MSVDRFRLPRVALPRRYELELVPHLDAAQFTGTVRISLDVMERCAELVLNAADLTVHAATLDGAPTPFALDAVDERLVVTPSTPLAPGPAVLELHFTGTLNDKLRGFYRSTYVATDGTPQVIATTQMQATDCRRAFPCWDEPEFKAVFAVTLVVDPGLLAISNEVEIGRVTRPDGKVAVQFADTMPMSTYLVAFVVGPLAATDPVDVNGTPVRIVHVPGKEHLTPFGLDAAVAGLRYFEEYYGIPYPGGKIDLVGLPDFAAGAMENVGCITFRESLLLVDPAASTQPEQQNVVDVVTHELAHMWFGDLVTMRWWNGIWLNEAFATFMEVEATDAYRPDWRRWTSFALERGTAFEVDALASTRPVEYEVRSPADADGMFDVLTYQKGGALLRMLQQYLGPDRFRDGVRRYLGTHAYANTETSDLWDAIEQVSGEPVRALMDSWIWQPGFPLVSASVEGSDLVLHQQRFGYTAPAVDDPARWVVPVHVRQISPAGDHTDKVLLEGDRVRVPLTHPDAAVVVNAGGHGFFRVSYEAALRARLAGAILDRLDTVDRFNLVSDTWAAVVAGRLPAADFLTLADGFTTENELAVWQALVGGLRGCHRLVDEATRPALAARVRALVRPAVARLGWHSQPGEPQLTSQLRGLLVHVLAVLGDDTDAVARCRELFEAGVSAPATVEADLLASATTVVAATGDAATYERFVALYRAAATPQEALRYLNALAEFDDAELIARTCAFAMSGDVKTQNAPFLLRQAIANRRHGAVAWAFVRHHWAEANERFPGSSIVRMVDSVKLLDRPEDGADVQAFFAEHDIPQAAATLRQILERQQVNIALRAAQGPALAAALA